MKKTDIKRLLCTSISATVVLSLGAGALADEVEVTEEGQEVMEETEESSATETEPSEEMIVEEETEETEVFETEDVELPDEIIEIGEETETPEYVEDVENEVVLAMNGWSLEDDGWYYYVDGEPVTGWYTIKGKKYHFNPLGVMSVGFDYFRDTDGKYHGYVFDENGHMLKGWQKVGDDWYYLGSDGRALTGWQKINKKWYYFQEDITDGRACFMYSDGIYDIGDKMYCFNSNGVMQTGWINMGGYTYYAGSDGALYTGWKKMNKKWFYFFRGGDMATGREVINGELYYFGSDGVMVSESWIKDDNKTYYFTASGKAAKGWTKISGSWYYFEGKTDILNISLNMVTGLKEINGDFYLFDDSGKMQADKWKLDPDECDWWYFGSNGKAANGWKKIDNKWYYFRRISDTKPCYMVSNETIWIKGSLYSFDNDGVMRKGWYDNCFFGSDGAALVGWQQIGNDLYYFSEKGKPVKNTGFNVINGTLYYFDKDGKLKTNCWVKVSSYYWYSDEEAWVYIDAEGSPVSGMQQINGKWYYFSRKYQHENDVSYPAIMRSDCTLKINGNIYHFDQNGVRISNKWYKDGYGWRYFDSNGIAVNSWQTIGGKAYYFENFFMETGWKEIDGYTYYFDDDGVRHTGWLELNGNRFYLDGYGHQVTGWKTIDGKTYYFNSAASKGIEEIDGYYYYFNDSGVMQTNCWNTDIYGYTRYYDEDGKAVKEGPKKIGDKTYLFMNSALKKDGMFEYKSKYYYADANGVLQTGWICTNKDRAMYNWIYCSGSDCAALMGWQQINGNWYYLHPQRYAGGYYTIDGVGYQFNAEGVCLNK